MRSASIMLNWSQGQTVGAGDSESFSGLVREAVGITQARSDSSISP